MPCIEHERLLGYSPVFLRPEIHFFSHIVVQFFERDFSITRPTFIGRTREPFQKIPIEDRVPNRIVIPTEFAVRTGQQDEQIRILLFFIVHELTDGGYELV